METFCAVQRESQIITSPYIGAKGVFVRPDDNSRLIFFNPSSQTNLKRRLKEHFKSQMLSKAFGRWLPR